MATRKDLIIAFERNMNLVFDFRDKYAKYIKEYSAQDQVAFPDSNITNKQYYDELIRISNIEYSYEQHQAIKTVHIEESLLEGYINNLNVQYENLIKLYNNLLERLN